MGQEFGQGNSSPSHVISGDSLCGSEVFTSKSAHSHMSKTVMALGLEAQPQPPVEGLSSFLYGPLH